MRGKMIVCDGSNGAGKTTLINSIKDFLEENNKKVILTREPGGTLLGEKIRDMLLSTEHINMSDTTELLLFAASRSQHIHEKILPALNAGYYVISDRFDTSTISFQQYARGIDPKKVSLINNIALCGFTPDLYLILDIDPLVGLHRINERNGEADKFEELDVDFLNRARDGYLAQAKNKDNFFVIDASLGQEFVAAEAKSIIYREIF